MSKMSIYVCISIYVYMRIYIYVYNVHYTYYMPSQYNATARSVMIVLHLPRLNPLYIHNLYIYICCICIYMHALHGYI